jgi:ribosome-binding ATPase YchF (GTP1/OBG family)
MAVCADLLVELARLPAEEAEEFAGEYGVNPAETIDVIRAAYEAQDVITFYTATGEKELRAWALRRGHSALEAAAQIHSDMAKGFIRAEAIGVEELVQTGSWAAARKEGLVRQEGKSYSVADGDVLNIKFAV